MTVEIVPNWGLHSSYVFKVKFNILHLVTILKVYLV